MKSLSSAMRFGFTLVELLVVIAITAILIALAFPAMSSARQKANEATCLANLKQCGTAILTYVSDSDGQFPASGTGNENWDNELLKMGIISDLTLTRQGCPENKKKLNATYGFNYMQLGNAAEPNIGIRRPIQLERPSETIMLADGHNLQGADWPNLVYWDDSFWIGDKAPPGHRKGVNIVWADGHASWKLRSEVYPIPPHKLEDMTVGYSLPVPYYFARIKTPAQ
jgi:prepilin-type N-terminal cleavage/methylation domain-containing protein/prepilin-type processing-associated H-X9-DG protein